MNSPRTATEMHENRGRTIEFAASEAEFRACSIVFTFLVDPENDPDHRRVSGVRLEKLRKSLAGTEAHQALVDPLESFSNDIISPVFRRSAIPLIALAEPKERRTGILTVSWPGTLSYTAEGDDVALPQNKLTGIVRFDWRDSIAVFESGHVAYIVALHPRPPEPPVSRPANEYDLLLLQKLIEPTEALAGLDSSAAPVPLREVSAFCLNDGSSSDTKPFATFVQVVRGRLERLLRGPGRNGDLLRGILKTAGLDENESFLDNFRKSAWECLAGGIVHIDGARALIDEIDRFGKSIKGQADDRTRLLAGIIQNVIDFPRQDDAELRDSFHPVFEDDGRMVFNHPRFLHEFTAVSRSLSQMKDSLGACPYLLLSHLLVTYNERLLQNAEREVAKLVYGEGGGGEIRVDPLRPLFDVLDETDVARVKSILKTRLTVFRNLELASIPNAFRYPTEKKLFQEVSAARGLILRKERFDAFFSRYESSLRDLHALTEIKSNRQRDLLLVGLTLLTVFDPVSHFNEYSGLRFPGGIMRVALTSLGAVALVVVIFAVGPMSLKLLRSVWRAVRGA